MCLYLCGRDFEVVLSLVRKLMATDFDCSSALRAAAPTARTLWCFSPVNWRCSGPCAVTTTRIHARDGRRINFFSCFWFFFSFKFSQSILCLETELRPLVHFDGELWLLYLSSLICNDVSFLGAGSREEMLCRRVISLVYRVNMLFIADVITC